MKTIMKPAAFCGAACSLFALIPSTLANAQTASDDDAAIVVTATRIETPADRLASSIDVIDAESIDAFGLATLVDALAAIPGAEIVRSGQPGAQSSLFLRGTNANHTLALFDGVRLNDPAVPSGAFDFGAETLIDAARVEVLRGPASAVYGSDAIGGVVNIIPRRGGETAFAPEIDLAYGSLNTLRTAGSAAGTVDALSYGVSAEHYSSDGFNIVPDRIGGSGGEEDGFDINTATLALDYAATDRVSFDGLVRARSSEIDYDEIGFDTEGLVGENDLLFWKAGGTAALAPDALTLSVRGGQVASERRDENNGVVTSESTGERAFAEAFLTATPTVSGVEDAAATFGVQYEATSIDVPVSFNEPTSEEEDSLGVYASAQGRVLSAADLVASVRYDDYDRFGDVTTFGLGASVPVADTGWRVFGNFGTSFRAPSLNERFASSPFVAPNPDLEAEEAESWEAGVAFEGFDGRVSARVAYYETTIENLIEYGCNADFSVCGNMNIGEAEIDGAEARIAVDALEWLTLQAHYAYTNAQSLPAPGETGTDSQLLRRPKNAGGLRLLAEPVDRVSVSLAWRRTGARRDVLYGDDGFWLGNGRVDAHDVVTISASFEAAPGIELYADGTNVLDETYELPNAYRGAPAQIMGGVRARL